MNNRKLASLVLAGTVGLAACQDTLPGTLGSDISGPSASLAPSETGDYMVRLKGNAGEFAATVAALGGSVRYIHEGAGFAVVSGLSSTAAGELAGNAAVAEVQPDAVFSLAEPASRETVVLEEVDGASVTAPATALRYSWQWSLSAIGAPTAWAAGKLGSAGVTVAILDSGLDYTSRDLNGLVDLSRSTSFVASDDSIRALHFPTRHVVDDFNGHGTNVATYVSSKADVHAGVTSKTTLIGVKVLGARGSGSFSGILSGILFAADKGADVINMSLGAQFTKAGGSGAFAGLVNQVLNYANRQGAVVVVAAGNASADLDHGFIPGPLGDPVRYPSVYSAMCDATHVVCVSAVGPQTPTGNRDVPAVFTNYGRSAISVAAPGGNIGPVSVWPWGGHVASFLWSMCARNRMLNPAAPATGANLPCSAGNRVTGMIGTSQASPHVAGLAALLVADLGKDRPAAIKARIQQSAADLGEPGTDAYYGKGRIDVARALGL